MLLVSKKKFNWRSFVSLYMTFSGIIMVVSGIILYLAPAGRISKWTHIYILGLEKDQWQAIHIIFTFLVIVAGGFHIYYNWKPLISYLRTKAKEKINLRKELLFSFILIATIFGAVLMNIQPFSSVLDYGDYLTDSWSSEQTEPPVPHAESMTIAELAQAIQLPTGKLITNLSEQNIAAQKDDIIRDIAEKYKIAPMELFEKMKTIKKTETTSPYAGKGLGRKTLKEVCETLQLDLEKSLQLLKENGYETQADMTLKDLARAYDKSPIDVLQLIETQTKIMD